MQARQWLQGLLGLTLLVLAHLYALAELVQNEPPRGTFVGAVYSSRTLQPIPNARVRIVYQRDPEGVPPTRTAHAAFPLAQGWQPDDPACPYPFREIWEVRTDAQGRFAFRGIPAGTYVVSAESRAHYLDDHDLSRALTVAIPDGQRVEQRLYLTPRPDFLHLVHPQAIYYPDEPLRVGIRGFTQQEEMELELFRVKPTLRNPKPLFALLSDLHYEWWRPMKELEKAFKSVADQLETCWTQTLPITGRDPEGVFTRYVEVPRQPEGIYILRIQIGDTLQGALIVVSRLGLVQKTDDNQIEFWCVDLRTGAPIAGVPIQILSQRSASPLAEGVTDTQGIWRTESRHLPNGTQLHVLSLTPDRNRAIHWATLYHYRWRESDHQLHGTIYTDRPIYRPGHSIHYKGIVRHQGQDGYHPLPAGTPVEVTVLDPQGEIYATQTRFLNEYSAFAGELAILPESSAGYYTIRARLPAYGTVESQVPVSAYRKPTYRIQAKPGKTLYRVGETVEVTVNTEYYFGMPVPNTHIDYTLFRQPSGHTLDEEEEDAWWEGSETPYGTVVTQGSAITDGQGRLLLRFDSRQLMSKPVIVEEEPSDFTAPSPFVLELNGSSKGWESARGLAKFKVAPALWQIRLEPEYWFAAPNQPQRIEVTVHDLFNGQPVQTTLHVKAGPYTFAGGHRVSHYPFQTTIQTNAEGKARFEWTPSTEGDWSIEVTTRDAQGNGCKETTTIWVYSDDERFRPYGAEGNKDALQVRLQKQRYQPGEIAEVAIRSPYADAVYYVSLEGDRLFHSQVVPARGSLTRVRIPITSAQIPSAYLSVCMVRHKQMHQRELPLQVGTQSASLNLQIETDRTRYAPRETVKVRVRATDSSGKPVRADLSLSVVDESLYAIREDSPNLLHRAFYSKRWNRVATGFSAPFLALQGDKGTPEDTRKEFPDTAFWLPSLQTDARGTAQTTFRLPDTLTEWRLTVRAHTLKTQVGYAKATLRTAKPLMVRLRAPLWLLEGDKTELNAIISNDTPQRRTLLVEWHLPDGTQTQQVSVAPNDSLTLRYPYQAQRIGTQTVRVAVREVNGTLHDAEQRTFEVKPAGTLEYATRTILLRGERQVALTIPPDARIELCTLEIETQPTILQLLTDRLDSLIDYPYGCTEQTVSRFVPAVLALQLYRARGQAPPPELAQRVQNAIRIGLQRLAQMETPNGGWGWWEADEPNLWATAYVVRGLSLAKQAGVPVPEPLYQRGVEALERLGRQEIQTAIDDLNMRDVNEPDLAEALAILAEIGRPAPQALREEPRLLFLLAPHELGWIRALKHWHELTHAQTYREHLLTSLIKNPKETADIVDWSTVPRQAQALKLLLANETEIARLGLISPQRYQQIVHKTALGLVLMQRGLAWYSSYDTALAIEALLDYVKRYEPTGTSVATHRVRLWVNDQPVSSFTGTVRLDRRWLRQGENRVRLHAEGGAPIVTARLHLWRPLPFGESTARPVRVAIYALEHHGEAPATMLRPIPMGGAVRVGTLLRIDVALQLPTSMRSLHRSVLEVPFPAGCAPIDTEAFVYTSWWSSDHSEFRDDRALSFRTSWWHDQEYRFSILVRAEVPGQYTVLPTRLWGMYLPYSTASEAFRLTIHE